MKKLLSLLLILTMLLSFAACAKNEAPTTAPTSTPSTAPTQATEPQATEPTVPATSYPITLVDQAGRSVTIAAKPERIVSGYYISTSAIIALGLKDKLVGIEAKAGSRAIYKLSAPELISLPNVGTAKEFNLEGCLALNPDLVILPLKLKSAAQTLEEMGIATLLVNPESKELLQDMLSLLAQATDSMVAMNAYNQFLTQQQNLLGTISGNKPTVYLAGNSGLLSTAGANMYQNDMIAQAGGVNVAETITDSNWANISYEQLLAWNPEYIILASDATYTVEDVMTDANLASCRAVVNGKVFHLPGTVEAWDSPVPSCILGSLWVASVLHADVVSPDAFTAAANEFYSAFYGFEMP